MDGPFKHNINLNDLFPCLGGLEHALSKEFVKCSDVAVLDPFDYTSMICALGIDIVIFGFGLNWSEMFRITLIVVAWLTVAISQSKLCQTT